jgi:glycosyltransferase involved in cell wall biosynthesis
MPFLPAALDSILQQTCHDLELIAVDDESTDGSLPYLRQVAAVDSRMILVENEHRGVTAALNDGLRRASGEFIARMDADDRSHRERIAQQLDFLRRHPAVVAVGCWVRRIDEDGDVIAIGRWPESHADIYCGLLRGCGGLPHPGAMMRRAAVLEVGGYREQFRLAQDKDLWLRLAEQGQLANLPLVLLDYREHRKSLSRAQRLRQQQQ